MILDTLLFIALLCNFSIKRLYNLYQQGMVHQDWNDANEMREVIHTLMTNEPVSDCSRELQKLVVKLEIPQKSEECAICLDKIDECEVTGFEMLKFDKERPSHRKMVLPCDHSFSANALLVHWLTCPMRCPLCRAGVEGKLCIENLPEEWNLPAKIYLDKYRKEQEELIEREAAEIAASVIAQDLVIHNRFIHVSMQVLLLTNAGTVHRMPLNFSQAVERSTGNFCMRVARADVRLISAMISKSGCYAMTISVFSHIAVQGENGLEIADTGSELANSGLMRLPHAFSIERNQVRQNDFPQTGDVSVFRNGHNINHPTVAENSSFNVRWFYQNNRMLDTLINIEYRISMSSLMTFVAHEAVYSGD